MGNGNDASMGAHCNTFYAVFFLVNISNNEVSA